MNDKQIYLDYNSTTPVSPQVLEAMLPYFSQNFGNPASRTHSFGWIADEAVKVARSQAASLINASEEEIIFTSCATESVNLAIKGAVENYANKGRHIVTVSTEHNAVLDTCRYLQKNGFDVTIIPVSRDGIVDVDLLRQSITGDTILVSVMYANNETGVIQPLREISGIVHEKGCLLLSDATQAAGKITVDVVEDGIDLLCFSSHKMYGPKGAAALYVRRKNPRVKIVSQIHGGGHEKGLRSGTLNVPSIVGFGKACEMASYDMWVESGRMSKLRTILEQALVEIGNVHINGTVRDRLPNVTNLSFGGARADALISMIPDIAVSTGSACSSAINEPSHVLKAMGLTNEEALSSVRFSLGKHTTEEDIVYVAGSVKNAVLQLRSGPQIKPHESRSNSQ